METISLRGTIGKSIVLVGELFANLPMYIPESNVYIITDKNVLSCYGKSFPKFPTFAFEPGEGSKSMKTATDIFRWLLNEGADRDSFILGVGGGVVCDLAGFVASTYMRGVKFGFVATSLLAQVDASVGGKNGVNLDGFKNIVGVFNQPKFVICDINMLSTLPKDEYFGGFAEIVKHALISDSGKFKFIVDNIEGIKSFDPTVVEFLVNRSVHIKAEIVEADEYETDVRRKLNLGHTWGHAVEKITGLSHGQAISIGLSFTAKMSLQKGYITQVEYEQVTNLLVELGLPITTMVNPYVIFEAIAKDKKKTREYIYFVLMKGIGDVVVEKLTLNEIRKFVENK